MKNEQEKQIEQLRLTATLLETGHPFEVLIDGNWVASTAAGLGIKCPLLALFNTFEIRLALATPGDGRILHNPDNLTAEQVGAGWRLIEEATEKNTHQVEEAEYWDSKWFRIAGCSKKYLDNFTYRLPLTTPWPEAKVEPRIIPLVALDVPPGSVFRFKAKADWVTPLCVGDGAVGFPDPNDGRVLKFTFSDLVEIAEINRSIPLTGKWDADAWVKCEKEG